MPDWTKEQKLAIDETGKNIIVSAGAGSGKTAVLSERVLQKVLNGVDIDRLLILTFTKAAAEEMKDRIRKKIKKNNIIQQLNKIDSSYITTFDSYSLSLVKKYHYLLNVKKNVNVIESNVLKIKTKELLDEIMEEEYQKHDDNFVKLINDFCVKDDENLKKALLVLHDKLNMKYNKKEYLNNYLNAFYQDSFIKNNIELYEKLLQDKVKELNILLTKIANLTDADYFSKLILLCKELIDSSNYDDIKINVSNISRLPNLPKNSDDEAKKVKEEIKKVLDEIKELTSYDSKEALFNSIMMTKPSLLTIIDILQKLDNRLNNYKNINDLYDFVDISKMAIKIVKENKNICEEIKNYFLEIMVDEYQDTSDLQEEFISLIANNNLYMVGDVKQSIYRFRNANPDIFRYKYNHYANCDGGIKIDLLKNFRSREEVLNNINLIFDYIMSDDIGGADYLKEHRMNFGNLAYNQEGLTKQNNNMELYLYNDENIHDFTKDEIEAFIIAQDIKEKVKNHYQIFDKDKKELRSITYDDFAILIDRSTNFELYKKIFLYYQIPLSIYKDEYLTNSDLFLVIKNIYKLLSLVKNNGQEREKEYCFLSISRSFLCQYDDGYIFSLIKNKKYEEDEIFEKIKRITNDIESKTINMILDEIIDEFHFYEKLRTIGSLNENIVKIEYLYSLGSTLNQMGYNYTNFVDFLNHIFDNETDISFSMNKENGNSVKIMTIHKSKGLEYHICYFPGLTKKFNDNDLKAKMLFSNQLGIITPVNDDGITNTFYKELFNKEYLNNEISEKIRLFYVALTRAKEKMIFVLPFKEEEEVYDEKGMVDITLRRKYHSFSDILLSIKSKLMVYEKKIDVNQLNLSKKYNLINNNNLFSELERKEEKINIIDYPKYQRKEKKDSHFSKNEIHLIDKKTKEMMDFGTKIHYYMETMDFKNPNFDGIEEEYIILIKNFLNSDLMKNKEKAKIYQEYEFIINDNDEEKHGIIDLMMEYDNYIDIIDYKLKNILDEAYKVQLSGYRDYIEKLTNKKVNLYLYSIMDNKYQEI